MHYQTTFIVPEHAVPFYERALDPYASALLASLVEAGLDKGKWEMQAIFETKPDVGILGTILTIAALSAEIDEPEIVYLPLPEKNWLRESLKGFPPVQLGRYYIYGSHFDGALPPNKITLKIDAATAFGSGEHATTQGCLAAFDDLIKTFTPKTILDMGTGSGILSMAAAKALDHKVMIDAVDVDPESVRVAKQNIIENNVAEVVRVFKNDGYQKIDQKYDLIFENILARPLMEMAEELKDHLNPGGYAILSGFLTRQERWVLKAHTDVGLTFVQHYKIKEWGTVVVKRD